MRKKAALLTTLGLMVNLLLPQPVSADYLTGDLQRLPWLCNDYQLPIKGYVIEGWFSLYNSSRIAKYSGRTAADKKLGNIREIYWMAVR